jgi:hypothetical protein
MPTCAAGHHAAGALGRAHQLRPHLGAAEPPGGGPAGPGALECRDLPRAGRAHGLHRALLQPTATRQMARAPSTRRSTSTSAAGARLGCACRCPRPRLPTAASPRPAARRRPTCPAWACPTTCPTTSAPSRDPALAARYPLAMISPPARHFLNSTFVNVASLRAAEKRAAAGAAPAGRGRARHRQRRGGARPSTTAALPLQGRGEHPRAAGRRQRPGHLVAQVRAGRHQRQRADHQRLTDMGRAPSFYDCLVEVALDGPRAAAGDGSPAAG